MTPAAIEIRGINKRFGDHVALDNVHLDIRPGEFVALLGPSGSGKTSLLRIIAGLESADSGQIMFGVEDAVRRHPGEREVGFVFQHYALFRHMTVFENVAFGLRVVPRARRLPRAAIAERVVRLLKLVQLGWLADRYPAELSGGQRQRVALARALAIEPKVLLLTSPSPRSMPRCARSCAAGCASCTGRSGSPACSSPMTRTRRWNWPTGWW